MSPLPSISRSRHLPVVQTLLTVAAILGYAAYLFVRAPQHVVQQGDDAPATGETPIALAGARAATARDAGPERSLPRPHGPPRPPTRVDDWRAYSKLGHRLGPADARVTITVFSDYECPACRRTFGVLHAVQLRYPRDVSVVIRHYPLGYHKEAFLAALSAECASAQGRFEEYSRVLFEAQNALPRNVWSRVAERAGVADTAAFFSCVAQRRYAPHVRRDEEAGRRLGVTATPTVLVNGWRLQEASTEANIDSLVRRELADTTRH
jgi:predicted DsbA family dithiol-disulfide isomerase